MEFALIIPLLALLLFGIIQYGFILAAHLSLRNASAVGARHGVLSSPKKTISQIEDATRSAVGPMLPADNIVAVTVNTNVTVVSLTGATSVQIQYNLPLILPFVVPGKTASGSLTLSGTTIMR